jgi:hypothetical protein
MLWDKGADHEQDIMRRIGLPVLDLSNFHGDEKERLTAQAITRQALATS